jgi:hypothetical protein
MAFHRDALQTLAHQKDSRKVFPELFTTIRGTPRGFVPKKEGFFHTFRTQFPFTSLCGRQNARLFFPLGQPRHRRVLWETT